MLPRNAAPRFWPALLRRTALILLGIAALSSCRSRATSGPERSSAASSVSPSSSERLRIVDVHVHLSPDGAKRLGELMQRYGIDHVVNLSGGDAQAGLPQQLKAATAAKLSATTFTTLSYAEVRFPDYGKRMAQILRASHAMGAKGLKIAKVLGLGLPSPDRQRLLPVDDPGLDVVFETAGELGMPVAIHTGDPLRFWDPPTPDNERYDELRAHPGWSAYGRDVPSFEELYAQLERRFARHPKTQFISVHFGNLAEKPERVAETLRKYPNVHIDTAARIPEMGRHDPATMRRFFEEFQDRILFGSDLGVGPEPSPLFLGSSGSEPPTPEEQELFFSATRRYFETADVNFQHPTPIQGRWTISGIDLPRSILDKVFHQNAVRLLGIQLPR